MAVEKSLGPAGGQIPQADLGSSSAASQSGSPVGADCENGFGHRFAQEGAPGRAARIHLAARGRVRKRQPAAAMAHRHGFTVGAEGHGVDLVVMRGRFSFPVAESQNRSPTNRPWPVFFRRG